MQPDIQTITIPAAAGPGGQSVPAHRLQLLVWGDKEAAETVICTHGLTRNAHDFDYLAQSLAARYRVICPDMAGRGGSEYFADPVHYHYATYVADMVSVLQQLAIKKFHWVGTSMGGIMALMLANSVPGLMTSLVLNDIGCLIPASGLRRIVSYVGSRLEFANRSEAETELRSIFAPFGIRDETHWRHLMDSSLQALPEGKWRLAYDPLIAKGFPALEAVQPIDLWALWPAIAPIPTLILRGEESDILLRETALHMQADHPACVLREIPGCGHAPALMDAAQIALVTQWIKGNSR